MRMRGTLALMIACSEPAPSPVETGGEAPECLLEVGAGAWELPIGDTMSILATNATGEVRFASDAPDVAWVSESGDVTARSVGRAQVTVSDLVCARTVEVTVLPRRCSASFIDEFSAETLGDGWTSMDIGEPGVAGSHAVESGELTIRGAGDDIWFVADQFRFVHRAELRAGDDFTATVKVVRVEDVQEWTKAVLMVRDELTADARFVGVVATPGDMPDRLQYRSNAGDVTYADGAQPGLTFPYWLRLEKSGSEYTASLSEDGEAFRTYARATLDLVDALFVGLAVTSNDIFLPAEAVFDDFRIECP